MNQIHNPILRGFNPDPSICRAGDDYYIATSTFEWFPGVQIHHSKDLKHWQLLHRPLTRLSQLDMRGDRNSGGIWAPCLSYHEGMFYLIYTDVKTMGAGAFLDCHNYLVTCDTIDGEWSEPVFLNSSGFDPSLFHDDDGRKWLVNMKWDFRKDRNTDPATGRKRYPILLQEYDPAAEELTGPVTQISNGTAIGMAEAPHLYKRGGYYYLMLAEGGTGYGHAVTMLRAQNIDDTYEEDPGNPVLTAAVSTLGDAFTPPEGTHTGKNNLFRTAEYSTLGLQKAGHASLVETKDGQWYLPHLCGRPLLPELRCTLGRETGIQKGSWTNDGWFRLDGGNYPQDKVPAPDLPKHPFDPIPVKNDFDDNTLDIHFQSLRVPMDDSWMTLDERKGWLRLYGRESLSSLFLQSVMARRIQSFTCCAGTLVDAKPEHFQQAAGLICYYDTGTYHYLHITHDEELGRCLGIYTCHKNKLEEHAACRIPLTDEAPVYLGVDIDHAVLQFRYSKNGAAWTPVGPKLDATILSDEAANGCFTGAFVGMCCQDMAGTRMPADFDYFTYKEMNP